MDTASNIAGMIGFFLVPVLIAVVLIWVIVDKRRKDQAQETLKELRRKQAEERGDDPVQDS